MYRLLVVTLVLSLSGCASVVNDSTLPVKVQTVTQKNEAIDGADCKWTNDYGSATMKSGETTQIRRSNKDLDIVCTHPNQPKAEGRLISRANAGLWGNIIIGGGIGAIIDHNKGTAYSYPTWVKLVFGQSLVFDRSNEKEGQPVLGMEAKEGQDNKN